MEQRMAGIYRKLDTLPKWCMVVSCLVLIALIGYIDIITGDYSILVFYLLPVSIASWFAGRWSGAGIALVCGLARLISDFALGTTPRHIYWDTLEDTLFLLIVAVLIAVLRTALEGERHTSA
jgi:uncharacterized membrane protein